MTLTELLIQLASSKLSIDNDWYCWREIKHARLPDGAKLPFGNQYSMNVALKRELHRLWLSTTTEEQKMALAEYYVSTWGGVRRNKPETLRTYVTESPKTVIGLGTKGVASWSKVLCIRDPLNYAIFDARVSVALNSLQIAGKASDPALFPLLVGQNDSINSGARKIRIVATQNNWTKSNSECFYHEYLKLLRKTAENLDAQIYTIEMLLFSQAELLLSKAFPEAQFHH
jgi:hypothetical protein